MNSTKSQSPNICGVIHIGCSPYYFSVKYSSFIADESDPVSVSFTSSVSNSNGKAYVSCMYIKGYKGGRGIMTIWNGEHHIDNAYIDSCSGNLVHIPGSVYSITFTNSYFESGITITKVSTDNTCIFTQNISNLFNRTISCDDILYCSHSIEKHKLLISPLLFNYMISL